MNQETDTSILFQPAAIATLANRHAIDDLRIFFASLQLWNVNLPPVYMYCCSEVLSYLDKEIPYKGPLFCKVVLDAYSKLDRSNMEQLPSENGLTNLFHDFTQEKCDLMDWALKSLPEHESEKGVLFCDADLCWLGPLPSIPNGKTLGLSPHGIHPNDEALYGTYNAGLVWMNDRAYPSLWKQACKHSRFFEQAALENLDDLTDEQQIYRFGQEHNYGWWRLFQSPNGIAYQKSKWSILQSKDHSGLLVDKKPVSCIHTHWKTRDSMTMTFNHWMFEKLGAIRSSNPKVELLLNTISITRNRISSKKK